jgi:hypothetical protein
MHARVWRLSRDFHFTRDNMPGQRGQLFAQIVIYACGFLFVFWIGMIA